MSSYGLFEADTDAQNAPERQRRQASTHLANAIDDVRDRYGDFLLTASGKDEFEDRWHFSKHDIRKTAEAAGVFPNTGTMRRIHDALKREFTAEMEDLVDDDEKSDKDDGFGGKKAKPFGSKDSRRRSAAEDRDHHDDEDEYWEDLHGPGSKAEESRNKRTKDINMSKGIFGSLADAPHQDLSPGRPMSDGQLIPSEHNEYDDNGEAADVERNFSEGGDTGREASRMVRDLYVDWAKGNGMRVASINTLEHYASLGLNDPTYMHLANLIVAGDCDCEDEDRDSEASEDRDGPPPPPSDGESEDQGESSDSGDGDEDSDSEDSSDSGEADDEGGNPFGGDDEDSDDSMPPGDDMGGDDQGFAGPPEGPQDLEDEGPTEAGDPADDMGAPAADDSMGGDFPDAAGPGDQFAIPDSPPDLPGQEMDQIQDDTSGTDAIPPEIIDEILGLPPGTVEQLVMQELSGGGDDPGMDPGGPPPEEDPSARMARRLFAEATGQNWYSSAPKGVPAAKPMTNWDSSNGGVTKGANPITPSDKSNRVPKTKSFADSIKGGPAVKGNSATAWGKTAAEGDDPAGGGAAVAPAPDAGAAPAASPTQPGPDDGALLDQASDAVNMLVQQKTQEYQTVIDPLNQALQALDFAQSVEQAANPLDVTPPGGSVDVSPSQAPAAQAGPPGAPAAAPNSAQPMQPTAAIQRHAFKLAQYYDLSERGYRQVLSAMSRKHYQHVAEAISTLPDPKDRMNIAAAMADMFKQDNTRFNPQAFYSSVGITAGSKADRAGDSWCDGKDRADARAEEDDTDPDNWEEREARRLGLTGSRHPFAVRSAGGIKIPVGGQTMDAYEPAGQTAGGKAVQPEFSDNNTLTNMPKMPGSAKESALADDFQRWEHRKQDKGLGYGGETDVHGFLSEHPKIKSRGQDILHEQVGLHNERKAFIQPRVAGWDWDHHLNGYITASRKPFVCTTAGCKTAVDVPSYHNCRCGRVWNTYAIGDSNRLASNEADMYIAREIPVRDGVIMANRQFRAEEQCYEDENNASGNGPFQDYVEDVDFYSDDELEDAPKAHAPGETDMDTTRSASRRHAEDYPDDHTVTYRDGDKFCSRCDAMLWDPNTHHCPAKQASLGPELQKRAPNPLANDDQGYDPDRNKPDPNGPVIMGRRRRADWTKFTDDDNAGYEDGPSGPPSTETRPVRKDWAKVDGKGRYAPNTFK